MSRDEGPISIQRTPGGSQIIAIGGGKGGIGKSLVSASLAIGLAQLGQRVVVIDADLGGANLHTCLGIAPPQITLSDFLEKRVETIEEVIVPTKIPGLGLVSGALDLASAANPKYSQKLRLLKEIVRFSADIVLIDLGAGTAFNTLDFFLIADVGIVCTTPEPTAVENAYRFIKAAFFRRLKNLEVSYGIRPLVDQLMAERDERQIRTPVDLVREVKAHDPHKGAALEQEIRETRVRLLVNQVRTQEDAQLGANMRSVCTKYFGISVDVLGQIPYDNLVWQAVRKRQPLLLASPDAAAAQALRAIAEKLVPTRRVSAISQGALL
jgi:flagellar biosynthesis protein FlhG